MVNAKVTTMSRVTVMGDQQDTMSTHICRSLCRLVVPNNVPAIVEALEGDDGGTKEPADERICDGGGEELAHINDMRSWSNVVVVVAEAGFMLQQMIIISHAKYI